MSGTIMCPGRFRALSSTDKKQIILLRSIIDEIGKEVALRTNGLDVLFTTVRNIAKEIPPSEIEGLHSITTEAIQEFQSIVNQQEKAFRDDELGIYHYELDEDLLIPIAHGALELWNRVEGFSTAPYLAPSDDIREKKRARVEQAKQKKEQTAERLREEKLEKDRQKEVDRQRREELKKSLASPFQAADTIEDKDVVNPRALGYIDYSAIPLGCPKEFSRAVEIWTFLVSLPQVLTLSQFSLSMFLGAVQDDSETFLIQETCRMLVQVGAKGSPLVKTAIKTSGRNWFDQLRDYLLVASGAKQQKKEQARRKLEERNQAESNIEEAAAAGKDENDSEEEREESDTEEDVDFATDFGNFMKELSEAKGRVGWGNFEIHDRLVILKFLVDSILQAPKVVDEADTVIALDAAEDAQLERSIKELREDCEKELRQAAKSKIEGEVDVADARETIMKKMRDGCDDAFSKRMETLERKDLGARIVPLGEDRYGRLYWRFPLESNVYVQAVKNTSPFPLVVKPKPMLMDDEEDLSPSAEHAGPQSTQTTWGKIAPADLELFINSLESRGTRESHLKAQLQRHVTHLTSLAVPNDKVRITRSRAVNKGYNNRLNIPAMLPY